MAASGKRKTTMAKLNRERGLLERRAAKQARKVARKRDAELGLTKHPSDLEDQAPPSAEPSA
jgi:hypothetical protein